jgi:hypothetical protein
MLAMILIALLAGAALAQQFRVLVLLPACGVVLLASVGEYLASDRWQTLAVGAAGAVSLQIGYIGSYGVRSLIVTMRPQARHNKLVDPSKVSERARLNIVPKISGRT